MMLSGGGGCSRLSPHLRLRDSNLHRLHLHLHLHHPLGFGFGFVFIFGLGFYNTRIAHLRCYPCVPPLKPLPLSSALSHSHSHSHTRAVRFSSILASSKSSSPDIRALPHCFSQREHERELPPEGLSSVAGGIVALGKFDALHIGHRELAVQASKVGPPFLLSFVGMAEVLGWKPRASIVAKCDRERVLSSWALYCGDMAPAEFEIEFSSVRRLTPRQFVEKLLKELGVCGIVAGENYRFGYKAAGDASKDQEGFPGSKHKLSVPKSSLLNLAPKEGLYEKCYLCIGEDDDLASSCRVVVDTGYVHIEMDDEVDVGVCNRGTQDLRLLRIEFGDSQS